MKRIIIALLLTIVLVTGVFAQSPTYDEMVTAFSGFADAIAPVLPFNASVGLNWSDAFIGKLFRIPPHLGVGVTVGVTTIPFKSMETVIDTFNITIPPELSFLQKYGLPLPAYTAEARIGGILLPFDIGLKLGILPEELLKQQGLPFSAEYLLFGADVRLSILKERFLIPGISIGAGLNYLQGGVGLTGLMGGDITLTQFDVPDATAPDGFVTHTLSLSDPSLKFNWNTTVFDFKVQVSKSLLILTPYAGLGASIGGSKAGGGLFTELLLDGSPITDQQIQEINDAFAAAGETPPDLSTTGIQVSSEVQGWSVRAFGGVSLNLLILRIDLTGMYNFTGNSYGVTGNVRIQL